MPGLQALQLNISIVLRRNGRVHADTKGVARDVVDICSRRMRELLAFYRFVRSRTFKFLILLVYSRHGQTRVVSFVSFFSVITDDIL